MHAPGIPDPVGRREFLIFRVGAEQYGIDILKVREIRSHDTVTQIANTPECMKGVINLRGAIVPIIDLRMKFKLGQAEYGQFTALIILELSSRIAGIVVDSVCGVLTLAADRSRAAPEFCSAVDTRYVGGVGALDERTPIFVDIERLMSHADMGLVDGAVVPPEPYAEAERRSA